MKDLEKQFEEAISDIHCDMGNWGECGGINRESRKEATSACKQIHLRETLKLLENIYANISIAEGKYMFDKMNQIKEQLK